MIYLREFSCAFKKNVYATTVQWNVLYVSVPSVCFRVWFISSVFLFIFGLGVLSMTNNGVLRSPAIVLLFLTLGLLALP